MPDPLISVVIPTYRRPHLVRRAVLSVLRQTYTTIEAIIVIDGMDDGTRAVIESLHDDRTRVIESGQNGGPARARNIGVQHARGELIALLDDDDEWTEDKLATQMRFIQEHGLTGDFVLSCRVIGKPTGARSHIWPDRLFAEGDDIGEYLLDRRTPFARPGMACSGTLLFPKSVARRVPFPRDRVHEDWSWLLLCVAGERIPLLMCPEPMFIYHLDPNANSQNKLTSWRSSLQWARKYRSCMSGVAFAGLLSSTTAWRAKRQADYKAFREIALVMRREGDAKLKHWFILLSVFVLPADFAERLRRLSLRAMHSAKT